MSPARPRNRRRTAVALAGTLVATGLFAWSPSGAAADPTPECASATPGTGTLNADGTETRTNDDGTVSILVFGTSATPTVPIALPLGVREVRFDVCGAQGEASGAVDAIGGGQGGLGGRTKGELSIDRDTQTTLTAVAGSQDGVSGFGGTGAGSAGNGGGLSGVFRTSITAGQGVQPLVVAGGGGGGAAGGGGGAGGGDAGGTGAGGPAVGVTDGAGGTGGTNADAGEGQGGAPGLLGTAGGDAAGSRGGDGGAIDDADAGGAGGGGGLYGGGGGGSGSPAAAATALLPAVSAGNGGAGGGGSGFFAGDVANGDTFNAQRLGTGVVIITFDPDVADVVALDIAPDPIGADDPTFDVFGTVDGADTATVTITVSDSDGGPVTSQPQVVPAGNEARSFRATFTSSQFSDGIIAATATVTDSSGSNGDSATTTAVKDTSAPDVDRLQFEDKVINEDDPTFDVTGSVTGSDTATVTVVVTSGSVSDTRTASVPEGSDRTFRVTFNSAVFPDGQLTATASATDSAGNTGAPASDTAAKDTDAPDVTSAQITPDPVTAETDEAVTVSGTVSSSDTATVTVVLTSSGGGTVSGQDVVEPGRTTYTVRLNASGLGDGELTAVASAVDSAGNDEGTTATDTAQKSTGLPVVTALEIVPDPVNEDAPAITVRGTVNDAESTTVTVTLTGGGTTRTGTATAPAGGGGFSVTFTASDFPDGPLQASATAQDAAGNTGNTATDEATKDTDAPDVTSATIAPDPVTEENDQAVTVSGTVSDADARTVFVSLTDADGTTVSGSDAVAPGETTYSVVLNASTLDAGTLTATARAVDGAGNDSGRTAEDTVEKQPAVVGGGGGGGGNPAPAPSASASASPSPSVSPSASVSPRPSVSPTPARAAGRFHPVTPARVLDTRQAPNTRVSAGNDRQVQITGRGGIPTSGVSAVVLNVTVTTASARGDLQVYPTGQRPQNRTSNLNFFAGETVAVQVQTGVSSTGRINLSLNTGSADVIVDVFGYYGDAGDTLDGSSGYTALQPQRLLDTRTDRAPVRAGADRTVVVAGRLGVPADATAVVLNTTVLGTPGNADLQVYPTGDRPENRTSNLNLRRGQTKANSVISALGRDGSVNLSVSQASAQVVLDVLGYYSPTSRGRFVALTPSRVFDTRDDRAPIRAGQDRAVTIGGRGGVPAGAQAAVLSVTGTGASNPVDLQVFPTGNRPGSRTSTINFRPGEAVANVAIATLGTGDAVTLSLSQGSATVILDAVGYITEQ